jgi:hypothetical protein
VKLGFHPPENPDEVSVAQSDAALAQMAVESEAVDLGRVLAYHAARHMLRDLRPGPEDVGALAQWLSGGPSPVAEDDEPDEGDDEDEYEDAPAVSDVEARDWWPPVLLVAVSVFMTLGVVL